MYNKCVIFTGLCDLSIDECKKYIDDNTMIIAADSGYEVCSKLDLPINYIVGDFDSLGYIPNDKNVKSCKKEKDDTDTTIAVKYAIDNNIKDIIIFGGLGKRIDHSISNIQTLAFINAHNAKGIIITKNDIFRILPSGIYKIKKREGYSLSLFSYSESVENLTLKGVQYTLNNYKMKYNEPIGVSNVIVEDECEISFTDGLLMVIESRL